MQIVAPRGIFLSSDMWNRYQLQTVHSPLPTWAPCEMHFRRRVARKWGNGGETLDTYVQPSRLTARKSSSSQFHWHRPKLKRSKTWGPTLSNSTASPRQDTGPAAPAGGAPPSPPSPANPKGRGRWRPKAKVSPQADAWRMGRGGAQRNVSYGWFIKPSYDMMWFSADISCVGYSWLPKQVYNYLMQLHITES